MPSNEKRRVIRAEQFSSEITTHDLPKRRGGLYSVSEVFRGVVFKPEVIQEKDIVKTTRQSESPYPYDDIGTFEKAGVPWYPGGILCIEHDFKISYEETIELMGGVNPTLGESYPSPEQIALAKQIIETRYGHKKKKYI